MDKSRVIATGRYCIANTVHPVAWHLQGLNLPWRPVGVFLSRPPWTPAGIGRNELADVFHCGERVSSALRGIELDWTAKVPNIGGG